MDDKTEWIIFDGEIVEANSPVVPAVSRGLMYGDGVFETFRTYSGHTFLLNEHLSRLSEGARLLGIEIPQALNLNSVEEQVYRLLDKQQLLNGDAIIRLQVWRDGGRGYLPKENAKAHFSITASACSDTFSHPELATVDRRRIPSESLPSDYKFTNGINYILAAREAAEKGADDALMQTVDGSISETTIANIFWVNGNTIFTPSDDCDLIPGITRDIVIRLIEQNEDWQLQKGRYAIHHFAEADAAWICNSVREILPVEKVDEYTFNVEFALLDELKEQFNRFRDENLKPLKN